MDSIPVETPTQPQPPPPVGEPPSDTQREPVIDEPGRQVPAVDPRLPGTPRTIREPERKPDDPTGPGPTPQTDTPQTE
jgi:hypothetical protein